MDGMKYIFHEVSTRIVENLLAVKLNIFFQFFRNFRHFMP